MLPVGLLAGLAACAGVSTTPAQGELLGVGYPGVLRAPETLPTQVLWRQRVTAFWGEGDERGFDAAVQRRGDTLTVLGLSPTGSVGFSIVQRGDDVELTNRMPERFPFPPRNVLLDVQRSFYPWLPGDPGDAPTDGERSGEVDGERVHETWRQGRLVERRFTRLDGEPAGTLRIRYTWDRADWSVPTHTELDNAWFGYRLEIETLDEALLTAEAERS